MASQPQTILQNKPDTTPDQKGDRVKVTMSGKFLPYKRY